MAWLLHFVQRAKRSPKGRGARGGEVGAARAAVCGVLLCVCGVVLQLCED